MSNATLLEITLHDIDLSERLLALIDQEFQALTERQLEALESLLGDKQILLKQLDQHAQQRTTLLRNHGLATDLQGLSAYAATQANGPDLLAASARLVELMDKCKAHNARNGQIIQANRFVVGKLLNVLQGTNAPNLYDSRGGRTQGGYQRPLSSA
ncbi:flagella synthesis protein FlgN [Pseudomonas oryzihabitans]|uniref:Flagella synthesis protein FlgN n=1 Tax=Pseudomonas oryzihabitans TaxID=47885 RepID=A0AAJ2BKT0_9PSED|nr:flagellar protein FlgN [Pseudomonas psychrotolerans]MDR6236043.1 flagella synthesis protein FlgN [Pseudomonas psychrotolerans]MDR6354644.1 flagella synthesis protein FlgN [Pseudomonas psychrotolerans]